MCRLMPECARLSRWAALARVYMEHMRSAVLALSVLLVAVVAAVAFPQARGPEPLPPTPPTSTPTAAPIAEPTVDPGTPPDFGEVVFHHSKALGKPAYHGRLVD